MPISHMTCYYTMVHFALPKPFLARSAKFTLLRCFESAAVRCFLLRSLACSARSDSLERPSNMPFADSGVCIFVFHAISHHSMPFFPAQLLEEPFDSQTPMNGFVFKTTPPLRQ